jgi:hypothetical protein
MEAISVCPTCYQPLTTVGIFQICPVHGQVSLEPQPHAPLRIFLSYGHDHNEELVRMIKTDLEKRGHDVWFDKNEIKFGDDWRRSITENILNSNRVLSFLSKYSTRDPGVCRDEIAIAIGVKGGNIQTILVETEQEVQPPVNIGHIQWLDMHDWQQKKAINEEDWKQWYEAKLAEIVKVVESDETRRFAGEIEKLNEYLKPIKSDARISGLLSKGFYGREWLFDAVENWRSGVLPTKVVDIHLSEIKNPKSEISNPSRLFWIMGDPGVGKSAFAAQLTHKRGDTIIAAQFCEWDKPDHRDARRVVCSIAFQLATRLPDYRKLLLTLPEINELDRKDASELFDYLLANPLKSVINGGRERHLIIIDALDEAGESGRNPLVEMLARNVHHLPDWLGIVVTSRPEFDVKTPFQALNPYPLDTKSESNKADICAYLNNKLATKLQNQPNPDSLVSQILEKSEGVFLYAERFCEDVNQGNISLEQPDQFPLGLGGIFAQYFQRQFPDLDKFRKEIRPALRAILAAREPLPLEILQKLFNWEDEELRDFIHILGSLFPVTKTTDSETIKPYHKSLADWLGDESKAGSYFVSEMEGHRILSEFCNFHWQIGDEFSLTNLVYHLHHLKLLDKVAEIIFNITFHRLKSKLIRGSYDDLLLSESGAKGQFGIISATCFGLKLNVDDPLFEIVLHTSNQWRCDDVSVRVCAIFSLKALESFDLCKPESKTAIIALRNFIDLGCTSSALIDKEREILNTLLKNARLAPRRTIESVSWHTAMTDHFYEDYNENSFDAIDAALALEPGRLLLKLSAARQFKAAYDCDGDPMWAFNNARFLAIKEVNEKFYNILHSIIALNSSEIKNNPIK